MSEKSAHSQPPMAYIEEDEDIARESDQVLHSEPIALEDPSLEIQNETDQVETVSEDSPAIDASVESLLPALLECFAEAKEEVRKETGVEDNGKDINRDGKGKYEAQDSKDIIFTSTYMSSTERYFV